LENAMDAPKVPHGTLSFIPAAALCECRHRGLAIHRS
jgi:hypothetical protein